MVVSAFELPKAPCIISIDKDVSANITVVVVVAKLWHRGSLPMECVVGVDETRAFVGADGRLCVARQPKQK